MSSTPPVTSLGIGSGLDLNTLLTKLMTVASQPLNALNQQEQTYQTQLSDYGQLQSAVSSFQSTMQTLSSLSQFLVYNASSSNQSVLTASADSTAQAGSHSITVNTLAQSQVLSSAAFTNSSTVVGTGTLSITVGSASFSVTIDSTNDTVSGIAAAINGASGNTGVTANVVNATDGAHLVLTSNNTGTANTMTVTATNGSTGNLAQLDYNATTKNMTQQVAAQDATLTVDGLSVSNSSNTVTGVIPGITLTLAGAGTTTLSVTTDTAAVTQAAQSFVDAYNNLHAVISKLQGGDLQGDSTLLMLQSQILNVINTPASGVSNAFSYLAQIGLSIQKDGTMTLDSTALNSALQTDFKGVANLFTDTSQGFAVRLGNLAGGFLQPQGLISARTDAINAIISNLDNQKTLMSQRLDLLQQQYMSEFTALDTLVGQMQNTGSFLSQQLGTSSSPVP